MDAIGCLKSIINDQEMSTLHEYRTEIRVKTRIYGIESRDV